MRSRESKLVVFLSIDTFLSPRGKPLFGVEEFVSELEGSGTPCVWLSGRSRAQLDEPRRALGHDAPFVAEFGSGVYLPEDYFHLKAERTMRLGRFTCIPVASPQPAAREALESLSEETGVSVVALSALSPRELVQNTGLPTNEAALARLRDFSELFFFAGAGEDDVGSFLKSGAEKKLAIRRWDAAVWSLSAGGNESAAIREVSKLYDRAARSRITRVGVGPKAEMEALASALDRRVALISSDTGIEQKDETGKKREVRITVPNLWEQVMSQAILGS